MPMPVDAEPPKTTRRRGRTSLSKTVLDKVIETQATVKRTMMAAQRYKTMDVIGPTELGTCMQGLESVYSDLANVRSSIGIQKKRVDKDQLLTSLQESSAALSSLFKSFGTERLHDMVQVCFGTTFESTVLTGGDIETRYKIMCAYCHPIGYKAIDWKHRRRVSKAPEAARNVHIKKNRIVEDFVISDTAGCLDCFDLARTSKMFHIRVHGIKFALRDPASRKTLIVSALVDDVPLHFLDDEWVVERLASLRAYTSDSPSDFAHFVSFLTLKDLLVFSNPELQEKYKASLTQSSLVKQRTISQATREFLAADLFGQRTTLMNLLVKAGEHEFQYLAYLLYDLLSTDSSGGVDAHEQTRLLDSLPWAAKQRFHEAMHQTVKYTSALANFDASRIPLEQQICLLKASDAVKEKAMLKLREVKAKSEDSGSKARQYLEGLLRIPFGAYREEPALLLMDACTRKFGKMLRTLNESGCPVDTAREGTTYTSLEVRRLCDTLENGYDRSVADSLRKSLVGAGAGLRRAQLMELVRTLNGVIKDYGLKGMKVPVSGKPEAFLRARIGTMLNSLADRPDVLWAMTQALGMATDRDSPSEIARRGAHDARAALTEVSDFMRGVRSRLDASVHGHDRAKRQLERIIGQWVNGEQTGYCFGFEGPPGVGKTSLAKNGVARCLEDENGSARPFAFVAIGGSSNGSTLEGHNYTYVGSTWGRIVDVLMEKKCMNPIIFIDELDKVSRTEHGRELVGILTHLVDPTQNEAFQDKYFNGVDLDLSRALFVFSYNDVDAIDRVLLDRIHRIRFEHLSMQEKLTVARKFLFPEIYAKMGLTGMVDIQDEVLEHIIEDYTSEAGVRKLKELLFEIVGEINLSVLNNDAPPQIPVTVSIEDLEQKYLKGRKPVRVEKIVPGESVGVITGLWANHNGQGGVLPVEARWRAADTSLDLKLTGMQGDVMKESMAVAATLACQIVDDATGIAKKRAEGHRGLHVHVPEGATPKDGPSAGAAVTTAIYSLLTGTPIRNEVAVTGEICLRGKVTAIGGLDLKIAGGIRAGTKHFLFPKDNQRDFDDIRSKCQGTPRFEGVRFTPVETIQDVLDAALVRSQ